MKSSVRFVPASLARKMEADLLGKGLPTSPLLQTHEQRPDHSRATGRAARTIQERISLSYRRSECYNTPHSAK